ncbi:MAG: VOC family protein [Nitrospinota bacterium]
MLSNCRFHHATVTMTDPERSRRFYGQVLGFQDITPPDLAKRVGFPFFWFNAGNVHLHVIHNESPECRSGKDHHGPARANHIAFAVDDIEPVKARLEEGGISYVEGRIGLKQVYIDDPDGNIVELIAPPAT